MRSHETVNEFTVHLQIGYTEQYCPECRTSERGRQFVGESFERPRASFFLPWAKEVRPCCPTIPHTNTRTHRDIPTHAHTHTHSTLETTTDDCLAMNNSTGRRPPSLWDEIKEKTETTKKEQNEVGRKKSGWFMETVQFPKRPQLHDRGKGDTRHEESSMPRRKKRAVQLRTTQ